MATAPVGYRLIDENDFVLQSWGGIWGQTVSVPDQIVLPNGDRVYCPEVGAPYPYHPNAISPAFKIVILEVWEMEAPPPPPAIILKGDIWRRATDAEADKMDAMLAAQPARVRNIYRDSTRIQSDDELFPLLQGGLTELFGSDRAAEILAPSMDAS